MRHAKGLWLLLAVAPLAACSGAGFTPVDPTVAMVGMPNAEQALQQAISRTDAAMSRFGGLQVASARPPLPSPQPIVASPLQKPVAFVFNGRLDDGVKLLADRIGYRFILDRPDKTPTLPLSLTLPNTPVLDVLRAIGEQAGDRADVIADPRRHEITLSYRKGAST